LIDFEVRIICRVIPGRGLKGRRYAAPRNDKFHGIDRLVKTKRGKETAYEGKTVTLAGRRYIVCRNHQEAEKDAADRAAIVAALTLRPLAPCRVSEARNTATAACQSSFGIVVDRPPESVGNP
jgi:hypothetical protein